MFKRVLCILMLLLTVCSCAAASSEMPYSGYTYDVWGRSIPAPAGFVCQQVFFLEDAGTTALNAARDLFVYQDTLYIVDSGNHRIVALNEALEVERVLSSFTLNGASTTLNTPKGMYIRDDVMYIADTENARVLVCDLSGNVSLVLERPVTDAIPATTAFRPAKVAADGSGYIYVLGEGVYQGLLCYDQNGAFVGFYGGNRVTVTLSVVVMKAWKKLLSQEQAQGMARFVPLEINNLFMDPDDFVFTVTNGSATANERAKGKIQRLNPLGVNVLRYNERDFLASAGAVYEKSIYGDVEYATIKTQLVDTIFVDIHVNSAGVFAALDRERGRVFLYDLDSNPLFVFGGIGSQKGTFTTPSAIELFNGSYVVLDEQKNNLTFFAPTAYAKTVLAATALTGEGLYAQALPLWEEVLLIDAGNYMAYRAIGKYYLECRDYENALKYLKLGQDRDGYSLAFNQYRKAYLQKNFLWIAATVIAALVLLGWLLKKLLRHWGMDRKRTRIIFH